MSLPLKIDFESLTPSPALASRIRREATKLGQLFARVTGCHVTVRAPHRHRRQGRQFAVHIRLTLPGREIVVSRDSADRDHENPGIAVRDAFDSARRQLGRFVRVQRGEIKQRPVRLRR